MTATDIVIILALLCFALAATCIGLWFQKRRAIAERNDAWREISTQCRLVEQLKRSLRVYDLEHLRKEGVL